jgi:predicted CXXCH cytochrome family protein
LERKEIKMRDYWEKDMFALGRLMDGLMKEQQDLKVAGEPAATGLWMAVNEIDRYLDERNIRKCGDCGVYHLAEGDKVVNDIGEDICDSCHENYIHCATCEEMKVNDQIADWDTKECFSCYEERVPVGRMA